LLAFFDLLKFFNFGQQIIDNLGRNYKSRGGEKKFSDTGVDRSRRPGLAGGALHKSNIFIRTNLAYIKNVALYQVISEKSLHQCFKLNRRSRRSADHFQIAYIN